jgi:hypothetical protein
MKTGGRGLDGPMKTADSQKAITFGQEGRVLFYGLGDGNVLREVAYVILIHDPLADLSLSLYETIYEYIAFLQRRSLSSSSSSSYSTSNFLIRSVPL